ncbi:MAG: DUF4416 family protein [Fibrobacterota bacterium]|nr:DUF4416 family protein [Chitinispirillaceae bacterium]
MADIKPVQPVKYFIASLYSSKEMLAKALQIAKDRWGDSDYESTDFPFDVTDYYEPEMGGGINRKLIVFQTLYSPTLLVDMKLGCNAIENELAVDGKRLVNLDAGYLDHNKVILASAKEAGQKVYLDKGIYADLAGRYKNGKYQPFEWSFPDFRDGRYDKDLIAIRKIYMKQLKVWRDSQPNL